MPASREPDMIGRSLSSLLQSDFSQHIKRNSAVSIGGRTSILPSISGPAGSVSLGPATGNPASGQKWSSGRDDLLRNMLLVQTPSRLFAYVVWGIATCFVVPMAIVALVSCAGRVYVRSYPDGNYSTKAS
ncbi:unnamed protein product [Protopolystoma xenopodis]|uniref:Uncharacterized protein n=1 Tax=Protopolystoma xenopodis TaxID=117903 RepID=A0A3S5CEM0_9PLAT|nr:unnamed protein product [Protopolystoma xenopodis]